jgi:hypothetical protein
MNVLRALEAAIMAVATIPATAVACGVLFLALQPQHATSITFR